MLRRRGTLNQQGRGEEKHIPENPGEVGSRIHSRDTALLGDRSLGSLSVRCVKSFQSGGEALVLGEVLICLVLSRKGRLSRCVRCKCTSFYPAHQLYNMFGEIRARWWEKTNYYKLLFLKVFLFL